MYFDSIITKINSFNIARRSLSKHRYVTFKTKNQKKVNLIKHKRKPSQPAITCSKLTLKTLEKGVKYANNKYTPNLI